MREIVRTDAIARRINEHGRIRLGKKLSNRPTSISTFRFTSPDEQAIRQIAKLYGGTPKPWTDGPRDGEWEVETKAKELKIALPPDPLGDSPIYEAWSAGGCQRRCDGEACQVAQATSDGAEMTVTACICKQEQKMLCKPKTRLNVILRGVRFGGVWRMETGGWNAAQEMPGMVEMISSLQERGVVKGLLTLAERKSVNNGQTKKFIVPALALDEDIEQLAAGTSRLNALAPAEMAELEAPQDHDDHVIDAEIVDEGLRGTESEPGSPTVVEETSSTPAPATPELRADSPSQIKRRSKNPMMTALVIRVNKLAKQHGLDGDDLRHALAFTISKGAVKHTSELDRDSLAQILDLLDQIDNKQMEFVEINEAGKVIARPMS